MQNLEAADLDLDTVKKAYARWAPIYDFVWGKVFEPARKEAVMAAEAVAGRVLEIGIGTGLSMNHYRRQDVELFGIDMSEEMLARARQRREAGNYGFVKHLESGDAHDLLFANGFFDCVVAQFVITLVASPERVLSECVRVVRPGGRIVITSHFSSERRSALPLPTWASSQLRRVGLRPEFPIERLLRWAQGDGRVEAIAYRKADKLGLTQILILQKLASEARRG